ncbi:acylneuraminate cytidylyltransferase family protein (plasmid) [Sulfitobacter sp. W027]|uniref:acylneuraminate cytidylyltransferase family protein n=1 Tax=Sulfitobacter sp. W027 TaxID=2867025 RepID=UPI0021A28841|nr:acylneuraminate cytidylyltransferase family protein [Sulfitobacter sp. W027]UWR35722.1 acylneuraminate cytidylyltransferase family protein [Sulfitobacter sp. W027]
MSDVLAVITARGGSKGLPRKNVRPLGGLPLIAWTVRAALEASCVARVLVSTDDEEIAKAARDAGAEVPFMRPAELASDTAGSVEVLEHALEASGAHSVALLLQPTSPLRHAGHIDAAFAQMQAACAPGCVSVAPAPKPPWLMYSFKEGGQLKPFLQMPTGITRRQDFPPAYVLNGALYFVRSDVFANERSFMVTGTIGYEMSSQDSVDIDTLEDFVLAERLLSHQISAGLREGR